MGVEGGADCSDKRVEVAAVEMGVRIQCGNGEVVPAYPFSTRMIM